MPGSYVVFNLLPSDPFDLLASCIVSLTQRINKYVCMYVGIETARAIRQWKKDTKERFAPWTLQMGKIENAISQRRKEIQDEIDRKKAHEQRVRDLRRQEELRDKEREMWEEKFNAELKMTKKKIELEGTAKASLAKVPS